jgi:CHAD domain-containing protein
MKHREAVGIIETRFRKINVTLKRLISNFATEDIHQFRIEVKKLRAFLHAIKTELKLPRRLRKFYDSIGIVRNLELQQQRIAKVVTETGGSLPSKYLSTINAKATTNIEKAKKIIKKEKHLKRKKRVS